MKARLLFVTLLSLSLAGTLFAQSGRKSPGSSSSTTTTTTTTPSVSGPKTAEKKTATTANIQLLVGADRHEIVFANVPLYVYDTVVDRIIRRLGEAEVVFATSGGNMNRADAIRTAKKETTRWVVVIEIRSLYADAGQQTKNTDQDELVVEFTTIEPATGKIKNSGKALNLIYPNGRSSISPTPKRGGAVYSDYSMNKAANEAADKILAGFDVTVRKSNPL